MNLLQADPVGIPPPPVKPHPTTCLFNFFIKVVLLFGCPSRCHENSHVFDKNVFSRYDILLSKNLVPRSLDLGGSKKQNWNKDKDWGQESSKHRLDSLAKCDPWVSNAGSQGLATKIQPVVPLCEKV